ncbi:MAG: squalene--hopene cyclase [Planctomycetales bacterium]|nr:squalene--hopene cyclase [Planctomycetales bacterium]
MSEQQKEWLEDLRIGWLAAREKLVRELVDNSHWVGELSTSALSTATAISALSLVAKSGQSSIAVTKAIREGCNWLSLHQNIDGGWGDTDRSHSNIATTLLALAAWKLSGYAEERSKQYDRGWSYVDQKGSWDGLRARYGKDKTFVVPILTNCALAGLIPWTHVPALPFEAAWLPQSFYRWAKMPVVSYAIPALVAIGQVRFRQLPPRNLLIRLVRKLAIQPTLRVLRHMQPASGGYLEAVPLTSFVLMSLVASGEVEREVSKECLRFILESRLTDGSWPIDTNLATWVTSLSVSALSQGAEYLSPNDTTAITLRDCENDRVEWLLSCQHTQRHPFTGAEPGGWGWTDLSGAVPDADDTPAALLALSKCNLKDLLDRSLADKSTSAVALGMAWLIRLQNRDGGWPTFCRGWGQLPFDRSGTDLTAHAMRALAVWEDRREEIETALLKQDPKHEMPSAKSIRKAISRGQEFLKRNQQPDGSWLPLWFGNQDRTEEDNPVYGTGRVLLAWGLLDLSHIPEAQRGKEYLLKSQNADGGWGGGVSTRQWPPINLSTMHPGETDKVSFIYSSIEETAVAVEGLVACASNPKEDASIMRACRWLAGAAQNDGLNTAWPIGFYFAKLWYYEKLYPLIFVVSALGAAMSHFLGESSTESESSRESKG